MPRKKKNARTMPKPKKIRERPRPVVLPVRMWQDDGISPGALRAVAEWRWEYDYK
ncbi:hypothetical protein [Thermotalea metallivorans]|uniref:Uncharacterized protein n=1 Tax=Thermotalea metallivorans TaxID=520762 RepID=A0A140LCI0_9FIRM|nr:hypothetical protein [Thermotalea metallivorans]KXG78255.1 hypothetical protein AN619_02300 [Thermotalea metallivorans]